ncbi:MAG: hypothetical protein V1896_02920 [Candidatus Zambryskibacteria bacterium]
MPNKFIKILAVAGVCLIVLPTVSGAQMGGLNIDIPYALSNELGVGIIPNYPRPNEMVFLNLELYTGDLSSADITWSKDGETVLSGKGEIKYSFNAGPIGKETDIKVNIKLINGVSFSKNFSLTPASVDMVWEANSYVPPFYRGKALHPRQGVLKIVAMPEFVKNGRRVPSENLVYKWSNDAESYQDQSGYGKNVLVLNGSLFGRSENLQVLISDPINNLVAQGFIDVPTIDPEIVFYENNPYYGHIFESAIANIFNLKTEEVQILAAPYFFTKESGGGLQYEWTLNGQTIPGLSGSRTAVFRRPEDKTTGRSVISLRMENTNRILQQADNSLTMSFE